MKGLPHSLETTPEKSERLVVARELPFSDVTIPNMQMEADGCPTSVAWTPMA